MKQTDETPVRGLDVHYAHSCYVINTFLNASLRKTYLFSGLSLGVATFLGPADCLELGTLSGLAVLGCIL